MYAKVIAEPGAKKEKITQLKKDHFIIAVKEKAERNAANKRILEVLSAFLNIPTGDLKIVIGHRSRSKIIDIKDPSFK